MKEIGIRERVIGKEYPGICLSITAKNKEDLYNQLELGILEEPDLIEIRIDQWVKCLLNKLDETFKRIREIIHSTPLIATYRTLKEGGKGRFEDNYLRDLYKILIMNKYIDVVDIEIFQGEKYLEKLMMLGKEYNKKIILSYHNFDETPSNDAIRDIFCKGISLDGDIIKIAVMPNSNGDVIRLLEISKEIFNEYNKPIIAISMGEYGKISRVIGGKYGSILTFVSLEKYVSAPGQLSIKDIKKYIGDLY